MRYTHTHTHTHTHTMMPLKFTTKWPKGYGFEIYGKGPCYVTFIEKGSVAHNAGLLPGDQILELDGQDATMMSSEALKTLAKHSREQPPSLEVVSCLKQVHIPFKGIMGYGFTLVDGRPVVVAGVDFGSPAYKAGLRTGDYFINIAGFDIVYESNRRLFGVFKTFYIQ